MMEILNQVQSSTIGRALGKSLLRWCSSAALGLGLLLSTGHSTSAQTWETLQFDPAIPGWGVEAAASTSSAVYISGTMLAEKPPGSGSLFVKAAILKSEDHGLTWSTSYISPEWIVAPTIYSPPPSEPSDVIVFRAMATAMVALPGGGFQEQVFALGLSMIPTTKKAEGWRYAWQVYRSVDGGGSFHEITTGPTFFYDDQSFERIAVDELGRVYVFGSASELVRTKKGTTTTAHGVLLKGTMDATGSYSFVPRIDTVGVGVTGVICVGSTVVVAGSANGTWQVKKSTDGGLTWTAIDTFALQAGQYSGARGLTLDADGLLLVAGYGNQTARGKTTLYGVVRKGTLDGAFNTIESANGFSPLGIAATTAGVHVLGVSATGLWVTRQGTNAGGGWSWQQSDGGWGNAWTAPSAMAIVSDADGYVYAGGVTENSDDGDWMLRRLSPTP